MRGNPVQISRKQEWALLYQHQKRQFQHQQLHEQQKQRLRKQAFKQALDQQRYDKRNMSRDQRVQDIKYSQFMQLKARRQEQQEHRKRLQHLQKRKQVEDNNLQVIQNKKRRHQSEASNIYRIGMEDTDQMKRKNQINKKLLSEELKYQQYQKHQIKEFDKIRDLEKDIANRQFELDKQQKRLRELDKMSKYKQNMEIYDLYSKVKQDKVQESKMLERKMIKEVALERERLESQKMRRQQLQKVQKTVLMKDSLLEQIQVHNKLKQNKDNSVNYNNKMYQQFYKDKRPQFDKSQYIRTLNDQMEDERRKKSSYKYMSDQEYKLNANYLQKALNGQSIQMRNDRSAFSIGNPEQASRRKDDIYFNKLGTGASIVMGNQSRELERRVSHSSQSIQKNQNKQRDNRRNHDLNPQVAHQDLDLIRQKIDSIMLKRQQKEMIRNRNIE